jgi:HAD superfamily hydrolase (TIGR01450 family)
MKAVVLAAGIGSRLRPITLEKPKCCVTVDSTPILAHQLRAYDAAGISEVYVVAGYLADRTRALCERVAGDTGLDVTVVENEVFANTDNMYSLYQVREAVAGEEFVLGNGDVVFDPEIVSLLVESDAPSAIACDTSTYSTEAMKITVEDGRVTGIRKDISEDDAYASSADVYRFSADFSRRLFRRIERTVEIEGEYEGWTEVAIDDLVGSGGVDVRPVDVAGADWVEIDDHADLLAADRRFSSLSDLGSKEAVFFDLDGTIYLDDDLVEGAADLVAALRSRGTEVFFLSNNSSNWKPDYAEKLTDLGIPTQPDRIVLSTDGVIEYLQDEGASGAYVVGTDGMRKAFSHHDIDPEVYDPEYVVVGFDTELTYEKARRATLAIRNGAQFLLAHPDLVCPTREGMIPDCGSIGALVEAATGREPTETFGKPNPEMIEHVLADRDLDPEDIAVVGDRLETEMLMAERLGCDSVCVLTGSTDRVDVETSEIQPTMVAADVGDLLTLVGMPEGTSAAVSSQGAQ